MNLPATQRIFSFENINTFLGGYQNTLFKDLDFSALSEPISFFRADFQGSKFLNSIFYKNNFDRSDFTSTYIENCTFENCFVGNFGICNSIVKDSKFMRIAMDGAEISRTRFQNCLFDGVIFLKSTVFDIEFIDCEFRGCSFERAGFENITFIGCDLRGSDFSDLTAVNFVFENTKLDDIAISLDYFGSYLFDKVNLNSMRFRYQNANIASKNISQETIKQLAGYLYSQQRYYEYYNLSLSLQMLSEIKDTGLVFQETLSACTSIANDIVRKENIRLLFKALDFHFKHKHIGFYDLITALDHAKEIYEKVDDFELFYIIRERYSYMVDKIKFGEYQAAMLGEDFKGQAILLRIVFDTNEREKAQHSLDLILAHIGSMYNFDYNKYYKITSIRQGSYIYDILTYGIVFLGLTSIIKKTTSNLLGITIDFLIAKKAIAITNKINNIDSLKKLKSLSDGNKKSTIHRDTIDAIKLIKKIDIEI